MQKAIDGWINVDMGEQADVEFLKRVKEDYLKGGDDFFRSFEPGDLLPEMDRLGIERAIVTLNVAKPSERVLRFVPPLVVSAAEVDEALAKLDRGITACMAEAAQS